MLTPEQRAVLTANEIASHPQHVTMSERCLDAATMIERLADSRLESQQLRERMEAALKAEETRRKSVTSCPSGGAGRWRVDQTAWNDADALLAFARAESQPTAAEIDEYNKTKPWP